MSKKSDKKSGYGGKILATAPIFALKAIAGDLPRAAVESAVESKIRSPKGSFGTYLKRGVRGRGSGRALGGAVGILTAPIFLEGLRLAKSKKPADRKRGIALLGASGGVYAGQKGVLEGFREARVAGKGATSSLGRGARLGLLRAAYKTPGAILLGLGVAEGRKGKKQSGKYLLPAVFGTAIGALQRGTEHAVLKGSGSLRQRLLKALPSAAGGAVGGALGGLVLAGAVDQAMKMMKKQSSVSRHMADLEKGIGRPLMKMAGVAMALVEVSIPFFQHMGLKAGMGYGRSGAFLAKRRFARPYMKGIGRAKTRNLAIGIREGLAGRRSAGWRSGILSKIGPMPETGINRAYGHMLGGQLRRLPPNMRAPALKKLQDFVRANPGVAYVKGEGPTPVLAQIDKAVDMALGSAPIYGTGRMARAYKRVMFSGRGIFDEKGPGGVRRRVRGLPTAGRRDVPTSALARHGPSVVTGALGLGALGIGAPLAIPLHLGIGAVKGSAAYLPAVERMALAQISQGLRHSYLPKAKAPLGERIGGHLVETFLSPGARDPARLAKGLASGGRANIEAAIKAKRLRRRAARQPRVIKSSVAYGVPAGAVGLAALSKARRGER
jgi:hypothetical protein